MKDSFDFLCMEVDVVQLYYKGDITTNIHQMKVQISVHSFLYVLVELYSKSIKTSF